MTIDTLAHALWAGAGAEVLRRRTRIPSKAFVGIVVLAVIPDVLHLVPMVVWDLSGNAPLSLMWDNLVALPGREPLLPDTVRFLGRHLYFLMHSAVVAAVVTLVVRLVRGTFAVVLLGWWSHIVIDVFTHSGDYYATPVFYPITYRAIDGIAWNTPWFFVLNYVFLTATYVWLLRTRSPG